MQTAGEPDVMQAAPGRRQSLGPKPSRAARRSKTREHAPHDRVDRDKSIGARERLETCKVFATEVRPDTLHDRVQRGAVEIAVLLCVEHPEHAPFVAGRAPPRRRVHRTLGLVERRRVGPETQQLKGHVGNLAPRSRDKQSARVGAQSHARRPRRRFRVAHSPLLAFCRREAPPQRRETLHLF
eukprot:Amastigsp_a842269_7.p3 type:complete len:183 gc:universal Amastigsp_a842269_7:654-106(-)